MIWVISFLTHYTAGRYDGANFNSLGGYRTGRYAAFSANSMGTLI